MAELAGLGFRSLAVSSTRTGTHRQPPRTDRGENARPESTPYLSEVARPGPPQPGLQERPANCKRSKGQLPGLFAFPGQGSSLSQRRGPAARGLSSDPLRPPALSDGLAGPFLGVSEGEAVRTAGLAPEKAALTPQCLQMTRHRGQTHPCSLLPVWRWAVSGAGLRGVHLREKRAGAGPEAKKRDCGLVTPRSPCCRVSICCYSLLFVCCMQTRLIAGHSLKSGGKAGGSRGPGIGCKDPCSWPCCSPLGLRTSSHSCAVLLFLTRNPCGRLNSLQGSVALHLWCIHIGKGGYGKGFSPRLATPTPLAYEGSGNTNCPQMPFLLALQFFSLILLFTYSLHSGVVCISARCAP